MIKIHEIIEQGAEARALEMLGKERMESAPAAADAIKTDFKAGADFIIEQVLGLQNQYPLIGIVTIQGDPNDEEKRMVSAKTTGIKVIELMDVMQQFIQGTMDRNGLDFKLVMMPRAEAARREAFQASLEVVKESTKLKTN
ncbi:MAG: hypothetical protein ACXIUD_09700 [Mongoliitalea sp.]